MARRVIVISFLKPYIQFAGFNLSLQSKLETSKDELLKMVRPQRNRYSVSHHVDRERLFRRETSERVECTRTRESREARPSSLSRARPPMGKKTLLPLVD